MLSSTTDNAVKSLLCLFNNDFQCALTIVLKLCLPPRDSNGGCGLGQLPWATSHFDSFKWRAERKSSRLVEDKGSELFGTVYFSDNRQIIANKTQCLLSASLTKSTKELPQACRINKPALISKQKKFPTCTVREDNFDNFVDVL